MPYHTDEQLRLMLCGLIDGSKPLPKGFPQCLSFPNDDLMIRGVVDMAGLVIDNGFGRFKLRDSEVRHLLFKMAACARSAGSRTMTTSSGRS